MKQQGCIAHLLTMMIKKTGLTAPNPVFLLLLIFKSFLNSQINLIN